MRLQKNYAEAETILTEVRDKMFLRRKKASPAESKQFFEISRYLFYVFTETKQKDKLEELKAKRSAWYRKED